jgi:hypothetical protein
MTEKEANDDKPIINIDTRWDTGTKAERVVKVHIYSQPAAGMYLGDQVMSIRPDAYVLNPTDILSKDSFLKFLDTITRGKSGNVDLEAFCLDQDVSDLLRLLGLSALPTTPIEVKLPANA